MVHQWPFVAVFNNGVIGVVQLSVMMARTFIWQNTAITLKYTQSKEGEVSLIYSNVPFRKVECHCICHFLTQTFTDASICILSTACYTMKISSRRNSSCITVRLIHHYFMCPKKNNLHPLVILSPEDKHIQTLAPCSLTAPGQSLVAGPEDPNWSTWEGRSAESRPANLDSDLLPCTAPVYN